MLARGGVTLSGLCETRTQVACSVCTSFFRSVWKVCCGLPESFPCVQVSSHPPLTNLPHPPPDLLDPQLRSAGAAEMQKYSHPLSIVPLHNNYLMQYYGDVGVRRRRSVREWTEPGTPNLPRQPRTLPAESDNIRTHKHEPEETTESTANAFLNTAPGNVLVRGAACTSA